MSIAVTPPGTSEQGRLRLCSFVLHRHRDQLRSPDPQAVLPEQARVGLKRPGRSNAPLQNIHFSTMYIPIGYTRKTAP